MEYRLLFSIMLVINFLLVYWSNCQVFVAVTFAMMELINRDKVTYYFSESRHNAVNFTSDSLR